MPAKENFWINSAPQWESRRYHSLFSGLVFSSLRYRRNYLLFILNQLPSATRVLELGCGSGLLYSELDNRQRFQYTGVDVSPEAIAAANRNFPEAEWLCDVAENIKDRKFDYVISAGLLDWISDDAIRAIAENNKTSRHVHSFSENLIGTSTTAHKLFARLISRQAGIRYEPRKFEIGKLIKTLSPLEGLNIVRNRKLSFGAFIHNLPAGINSSFDEMLAKDYFSKKTGMTVVESLVKPLELKAVKKAVSVTNKRVLEVGSGQGHYSRWLLGQQTASLLSIDAFVDTAKFVPEVKGHFQKVPAEAVTEGPFDIVLALGVLEFVSDKAAFLSHLLALLAPGARLLLLIPRGHGPVGRIYGWFHLFRGVKIQSDLDVVLTRFLAQYPRKTSFEKLSGGPVNFLFIIKADE